MPRQIRIKLLGHLVQCGQATPWHGGEIMMLIMQADIIRQQIQRAIVTKRLGQRHSPSRPILTLDARVRRDAEEIVLGNEVPRAGMQRAGEEGGEDEVVQRVGGCVRDEGVVERDLREDVEEV